MKLIIVTLISLMTSSMALASSEVCYEVSRSQNAWSRTPEAICLTEVGDGQFSIKLKSGLSLDTEVAQFNYQLLSQSRCMECNDATYGIGNPTNSTFQALKIQFNGKVVNRATFEQAGTVSIGATKLYYRSIRQ